MIRIRMPLTLTLGYGLTFLDSRVVSSTNPPMRIIVNGSDGESFDIDGEGWAFPALNWGLDPIPGFIGSSKGDKKSGQAFYIVTPSDYDELDFTSRRARILFCAQTSCACSG
jgi:hypothetical protein